MAERKQVEPLATPWVCPRCPDWSTQWPQGRGVHLAKHERDDVLAAALAAAPAAKEAAVAAPGVELEAPQAPATAKRSELTRCGYFLAQNTRRDAPFNYLCMNRPRTEVLRFTMRVDWLLCPVCVQPTQYAPQAPIEAAYDPPARATVVAARFAKAEVATEAASKPASPSSKTMELRSLAQRNTRMEPEPDGPEVTGPAAERAAAAIHAHLRETKRAKTAKQLQEALDLPRRTVWKARKLLREAGVIEERVSLEDVRQCIIRLVQP